MQAERRDGRTEEGGVPHQCDPGDSVDRRERKEEEEEEGGGAEEEGEEEEEEEEEEGEEEEEEEEGGGGAEEEGEEEDNQDQFKTYRILNFLSTHCILDLQRTGFAYKK